MAEDNETSRLLLRISSERIQQHRNALWEEEKHYTWWIYVIFGALIYIYSNQSLAAQDRVVLLIGASGFGFFISLLGYGVVRREGNQFYSARKKYYYVMARLKEPSQQIEEANKSLCGLTKSVGRTIRYWKNDLSIRDCFQLTFIVSAILFVAFAIFAIWHFLIN